MAKTNFEDNFEIYLFTCTHESAATSKLGEFLAFLKFFKAQQPYKFSFVSKSASLIPEMTLNENILIDFSPNSLTESKELQFQEFLKEQENRSLEKLYHQVELPHEYPAQTDAQMKKVCNLIKSILSEGDYIFLEEPEADLGPETLNLFIQTLKEHVLRRQINVFIHSKNLGLWTPHSHKIVERRQDFSFNVSLLSRNFEWQKERSNFYRVVDDVHSTVSLKFHIPNTKKKSEAA